ncbi:MAG TPA: 1-(5-phosphoribosyl)-5-[(5-phosphoribosylamino)methylideneamino]imidazole-4-carboxamide isomerase [Verrucomicrobia bacterium]|nr:MAG: 1-(5-phosphoribosyl)-5-[(5-phosphoribosylamino)methylideneamino]imidazole-4-carboxamide isomerase [Lentisphaerae bacterium GWF2_57_35]HBA83307.1 1-(5-phosphoribosyl)-5-[(5-phosphoribosylamino)methylideneamino]imidazole-4-carboxamide isomerase [Verrucomicrobiota bacterium]
MQVIPAIDLKGGKCVRLRQGRADESTVYSEDPVSMALHWVQEGGEYLHVVDLDGAFGGHPVHQNLIEQIVKSITVPVEVGGGLRTDEDIEAMLKAGVARVVLGTRAWAEPKELQRLVKRFGASLVVGIDARDGRVQIKGWTETTAQTAVELARRADEMGVKTLIYTDTSTDGMLKGPNIQAVDELCAAVECQVIASGGISTADDMLALHSIGRSNLCGAIVGKALYEGRVTIEALKKNSR